MTSTAPPPPTTNDRPALTERHCLEVACTECGYRYDDDEFIHHFDSIGDALRQIALANWSVSEDKVLCPECQERAARRDSPRITIDLCEFCAPPLFPGDPLPERCRCGDQAVPHVVAPQLISWTNPGFEQRTCITIKCTDCGNNLGDDDEGTPHFASADAAIRAATAADWLIVQPRLFVCAGCTNRRGCTALGHSWPHQPTVVRDGIEHRWCLRECGASVENPVTDRDMPWL